MTSKQAAEVAKILDMPVQDLEQANISRLSASALMSASWSKRYLVKIKYWLERRPKPDSDMKVTDPTVQHPAVGNTEELASSSALRFKKTL